MSLSAPKEHQLSEFLRHFALPNTDLMWFLGAGTSRTAGMPTADDLIWDLKQKYYCSNENQSVQSHDINNKSIRQKIQSYMDSKSFPSLGSPEEYSFYFELLFGGKLEDQQSYLTDKLNSKFISPNVGHRILAGLLLCQKTKLVFTTNFDEVLENTFSLVGQRNLNTFHLEGTHAALRALNNGGFPLYIKLHGDFKYTRLKNLPADLQANDAELQKCFLAASSRFGMVVSGYSGRDKNIMDMFFSALDQPNPFPHGLFWTTTGINHVSPVVRSLIESATKQGVKASLIEAGTFDEFLTRIWRQIPSTTKPQDLEEKIYSARTIKVSIPFSPKGQSFPVLRTNALPILKFPSHCGVMELREGLLYKDLKERIWEERPEAIITYHQNKIYFWGNVSEVKKVIDERLISSIGRFEIAEPIDWLNSSTFIQSFFEEALSRTLAAKPQLLLRKNNRKFFIVVNKEHSKDEIFQPLEDALSSKFPTPVKGHVPGLKDVSWIEGVSIELEHRGNQSWVLLKPDIWISPLNARPVSVDFLRSKRKFRYNKVTYAILDAWIKILLGEVGGKNTSLVECFHGCENPIRFEISTRTAYSRKVG